MTSYLSGDMLDQEEPQSARHLPPIGSETTELALAGSPIIKTAALETDYHLTGVKLFLVLAGIGLAIFLFALDASVISTVSLGRSPEIL